VLIVDAGVGTPAAVTEVPVTAARQLRIVRGSVAELAELAAGSGDAYLRVFVREPARAGLREEVQELLPNALEVLIDPEFAAKTSRSGPSATGVERSPRELFGEFCAQRGLVDPPVEALFARLHDRIVMAEG
jgi:exonuclease SbcD